MADNKKPFDKSLNSAEDWTTREVFNNLNAEDQRLFTFNMLEDYESRLFDLQQKADNFEKETDIKMTDAEVLQRKDVWSKKEVCDYFSISPKTFERWSSYGEIRVVKIGVRDYCRLLDLKDRLRDRGEDLSNI
ncbi:hypothetical protein PQZ08_04070 [Flavobacteriaceae bacterium]|nr:hypothetical protein [Flavobacteriaceae bacterium]